MVHRSSLLAFLEGVYVFSLWVIVWPFAVVKELMDQSTRVKPEITHTCMHTYIHTYIHIVLQH